MVNLFGLNLEELEKIITEEFKEPKFRANRYLNGFILLMLRV